MELFLLRGTHAVEFVLSFPTKARIFVTPELKTTSSHDVMYNSSRWLFSAVESRSRSQVMHGLHPSSTPTSLTLEGPLEELELEVLHDGAGGPGDVAQTAREVGGDAAHGAAVRLDLARTQRLLDEHGAVAVPLLTLPAAGQGVESGQEFFVNVQFVQIQLLVTRYEKSSLAAGARWRSVPTKFSKNDGWRTRRKVWIFVSFPNRKVEVSSLRRSFSCRNHQQNPLQTDRSGFALPIRTGLSVRSREGGAHVPS